MNIKFIIFITFIIFISAVPKAAYAQSFSLSIYPPVLQVLIKPGKTITQVYKIANLSEKDIEVTASVVPFKPKDNQGNIDLILDKQGFDKSINWFSLQNSDKQLAIPFTIKATQTEELVLKIKVPQDTQQKDYYYTLIIKNSPLVLSQGQTRALAGGILGANILITVSDTDDLLDNLSVSEFKLKNAFLIPNLVDSFDEIAFLAEIKNNNPYVTALDGEIAVKDFQGREIKKISLLPVNVLADWERQVICVDSPDCELGKRLFLGRYLAALTINSNNGQIQKNFYFYVLPLRASGLLIAVILFILFFIWFIRKID